MQVGSIVIHNGVEKEVMEITGDILILNDKTVVREGEVSIVAEPAESTEQQEPEEVMIDRQALRERIESLNAATSANDLLAIISDVDRSMSINVIDYNGIENIKTALLRKALTLNKIDSKVCESCGQTISE